MSKIIYNDTTGDIAVLLWSDDKLKESEIERLNRIPQHSAIEALGVTSIGKGTKVNVVTKQIQK